MRLQVSFTKILLLTLFITFSQQLQLTTDAAHLPLTFGSDLLPFDLKITAMDLDASGKILTTGTYSDGGLLVSRQFFALFTADGSSTVWIYYYDRMPAGSSLDFELDRMRFDPTYQRVLAWKSCTDVPQAPKMIVIDVATMSIKQKIRFSSSTIEYFMVEITQTNMYAYIADEQVPLQYNIQSYSLNGLNIYSLNWDKKVTTSVQHVPMSMIAVESLQNSLVFSSLRIVSGLFEFQLGFMTLDPTGQWQSGGGGPNRVNYEVYDQDMSSTTPYTNEHNDVQFYTSNNMFFTCFTVGHVPYHPGVFRAKFYSNNINFESRYEFGISRNLQKCRAIRWEQSANLIHVFMEDYDNQLVYYIKADLGSQDYNSYTYDIRSNFAKMQEIYIPKASPGSLTLYTYGWFKQQLDCMIYPTNAAQKFGFMTNTLVRNCFFLSNMITNSGASFFVDTNLNSNASPDDNYVVLGASLAALTSLSYPLIPMTEDIINVGRTCHTLPAPVYPNVTFNIGSTTTSFQIPKHLVNNYAGFGNGCSLSLKYSASLPINTDGISFTFNYVSDPNFLLFTVNSIPLNPLQTEYRFVVSVSNNNLLNGMGSQTQSDDFYLIPMCPLLAQHLPYLSYLIGNSTLQFDLAAYYTQPITQCAIQSFTVVTTTTPADVFTHAHSLFTYDIQISMLQVFGTANNGQSKNHTVCFQPVSYKGDYNPVCVNVYVIELPKLIFPGPPPTPVQPKTPVFKYTPKDPCLIPQIKIYAGETSIIPIPSCVILSADILRGLPVLEMNAQTRRFITIQEKVMIFTPSRNDAGTHQMSFTIRDTRFKPQGDPLKFTLVILKRPPPRENKCMGSTQMDKCNPQIVEVTSDGRVKVEFPLGIREINETLYANASREMRISIRQGSEVKTNASVTEWQVVRFQERSVEIQVKFENPLYISTTKDLDNLTLTFLNASLFLSRDPFYYIPLNLTLSDFIPPLKPDSPLMQSLESGFTSLDSFLKAGLYANLALEIVLGASMKRMWALINTLQILTHLPLLAFTIPANLKTCLGIVWRLANLNIVPQKWIDSVVLKIQGASNALKNANEESGYEKNQFVKNIGFMILASIALVIVIFILIILWVIAKKVEIVRKAYEMLKDKIMFGVIITFYIKGFLKLYINATQGTQGEQDTDKGQISVIGGYVLLVLMTISIPLVYYLLNSNRLRLTLPSFDLRFGALYQYLLRTRPSGYLYTVFFLLRRAIYALSIVFLASVPAIQLYIQLAMSLAHLTYVVTLKPFEDNTDTLLDIINEATVLSVLSILTAYPDGMLDPQIASDGGYAMIAIIMLDIVINAVMLIHGMIRVLWYKVIRVFLCRYCKNPFEEQPVVKSKYNEEMAKKETKKDQVIMKEALNEETVKKPLVNAKTKKKSKNVVKLPEMKKMADLDLEEFKGIPDGGFYGFNFAQRAKAIVLSQIEGNPNIQFEQKLDNVPQFEDTESNLITLQTKECLDVPLPIDPFKAQHVDTTGLLPHQIGTNVIAHQALYNNGLLPHQIQSPKQMIVENNQLKPEIMIVEHQPIEVQDHKAIADQIEKERLKAPFKQFQADIWNS